ncbi:MAG: hypothetical protein JNM95_12830 [Chitinophagaceae bacterium]|nr:hypothetical protein [Chitinophagaceae bacterium]
MRRFLSMLVLLLFVVYTTPRELWHAFSDHEDTIHHQLSGIHIEPQHHHCDVLQFEQHLPFEFHSTPFYPDFRKHCLHSEHTCSYHSLDFSIYTLGYKSLRAPPTSIL